MPHKPSIYDFTYEKKENETGKFIFNGYHGGYYRDFVPKIQRRRSRIRYDFDVRFESISVIFTNTDFLGQREIRYNSTEIPHGISPKVQNLS